MAKIARPPWDIILKTDHNLARKLILTYIYVWYCVYIELNLFDMVCAAAVQWWWVIEYILASDVINTQLLPHELNIGKCWASGKDPHTQIWWEHSNCEIIQCMNREMNSWLFLSCSVCFKNRSNRVWSELSSTWQCVITQKGTVLYTRLSFVYVFGVTCPEMSKLSIMFSIKGLSW